MNGITFTNVALATVGISGITGAIELARIENFIGAGICAVVGLLSIYLYERLPASPTI